MAIYTTFFVSTATELAAGLSGWKRPRARPVRVEKRNPLTGATYTEESREPDWPAGAAEEPAPTLRVKAIRGKYADYLDGRLRPFVRSCPHWAAKGVTSVEVEPLLDVLGLPADWEPVLYPPPGSGALLQQLPSGVIAALRTADRDELAARWAEALAESELVDDGWTAAAARSILDPLAALAEATPARRRMYLLTEW